MGIRLPIGPGGRLVRLKRRLRRALPMAHRLPALALMLRLKGETDDTPRDEALHEGLGEDDQITSRDAFGDGDTDPALDDRGSLLPLRGLAVAGATFVPTFLLIFFGVPYLLGPDSPIHSAIATVRAASESRESRPISTPKPSMTRPDAARSGNPGWPAVEPPAAPIPAPDLASKIPDTKSKNQEMVPPAVSPPAPPPPARSTRVETSAPPESREPEAAHEPTPPSLPPARRRAPEAGSTRETRRSDDSREESRVVEAKPASRDARDWTPAAAFTDRAAANRLASSIEKQGYPVEIRQDGSSSRPWVVWIGAQPSGGSRRR